VSTPPAPPTLSQMGPALVVLAGGLGSRFGGTKELAEVGPDGEALLDYTIFDAVRFGFAPVVLIVRSTTRDSLRAHLERHGCRSSDLVFVEQDSDHLAPPRTKPWGTVPAVVAAREVIPGSFAVANADDLYGPASLEALASHLSTSSDDRQHLMAFELGNTLSPNGAVNRGVCDVVDGLLRDVREVRGIDADTDLPPNSLVSMNLWGFTAAMMPLLRSGFADFLGRRHDDPVAEALLPDAVGDLVTSGAIHVAVHSSAEQWVGVTYQDDLAWARSRVAAMVAAGVYPASLAQANRERGGHRGDG
jgi:NDP-sugar pyrophosphorylase family protein